MENSDDVLRHVIDNEMRLLTPEVRRSAAEVERLLHPDFVEFGSSGRKWSRDEMLAAIGGELTGDDPPEAHEVSATRLSESVVLVTYLTERSGRSARRSSLWRKSPDDGWRLYFHQGTRIPGTG